MTDAKGPAEAAKSTKSRTRATSGRVKRGGAVPSPKKLKQAQQKDAVAAAVGKTPAGGEVPQRSALGVDQVAEVAEDAAAKLAENWRVIVAVAALVAVVLGFFWFRGERARQYADEAWKELAAAEQGGAADEPDTWATLAGEFSDTPAAAFMKLHEADALVRRGGEGDYEKALAIYAEVEAAGLSVPGFLAEHGRSVGTSHEGFTPGGASTEEVEGLPALPEAPEEASSEQAAPTETAPAEATPEETAPEAPAETPSAEGDAG
jgi:hypothetical protein